MQNGWNAYWRQRRRKSIGAPQRKSGVTKRRLSLEPLEDRRLLAAFTHPDSGLNSYLSMSPDDYRASSLIVQYRAGANNVSSLGAYLAGVNTDQQWSLTPGLREVQLRPGIDVASALQSFTDDPNVEFAEPDYHLQLNDVPSPPNDAGFNAQWDMDNQGQTNGTVDADIDAPEAWQVTTGSSETIVAVIDTGVDYNHPDLAANIWTNPGEIPGNHIDDDHNGFVDDVHGYDFANHDGDPMDDHFHGTHVAGTIGAVGNNDIGIAGINWNVKIMACKFLDADGGGYTSDAIAALNYAVANGATISNNSWGGGGFSQAFMTALQNAAAKDHIFVAAAGNDTNDNDGNPFYPAGYDLPNVVSVAATDNNDQLAWFSNYGLHTVDLAAPGVDIFSTLPTHQTPAMSDHGLGDSYGMLSGTSMATPHVTGVLALVRSLHPDWSATQVIDQVLNSVDVVDGALKTISGGRLNAAAAVGVVPHDVTSPRIIGSDPPGSVTGSIDHVTIKFSEAIDPASFDLSDIVSFDGPDGLLTPQSVNPVADNPRQFDLYFDSQTSQGTYTLVIGPHITDMAGNEIDQNRDGIPGDDFGDIYTATFSIVSALVFPSPDVPAPIYSGNAVTSYLTIDQDVPIVDLNLQLNISYPRDRQLEIVLTSPSGDSVELVRRRGGRSPDFQDTIFDDEAETPISIGVAPFAGSYQPEEPLSAFDGQSAQGQWQLTIINWSTGTLQGTLNSWSLDITAGDSGGGPPPPPPPPPPPENHPPEAKDDEFTTVQDSQLNLTTADLLTNDTDPDGDPLVVEWVGSEYGGTLEVQDGGYIVFTPYPGFSGQAGFDYIASDGLLNSVAHVTVTVQSLFEWHNYNNGADVNNDGSVTALDTLLIINFLNSYGPTSLERVTAADEMPFYYYDVQPDDYVTAEDAITVINLLNSRRSVPKALSGGEGEAASQATGSGAAIALAAGGSGGIAASHPAAGGSQSVLLLPATGETGRRAPPPLHQANSSGSQLDPRAVDQALLSVGVESVLPRRAASAARRRVI